MLLIAVDHFSNLDMIYNFFVVCSLLPLAAALRPTAVLTLPKRKLSRDFDPLKS
jgi:hypothetical protein